MPSPRLRWVLDLSATLALAVAALGTVGTTLLFGVCAHGVDIQPGDVGTTTA
ncbi:MAG: hypothetical protein NTV28_04440 [Propionibacteriales bacterium]|nr:hypothetical protein [Propionibacteriales bacterium]